MRRLRHIALALILGLSVIIGQHAVIQHELRHATQQIDQRDSLPASAKCADHSIYVSLATALGAENALVPFVAAGLAPAAAEKSRSACLPQRFSFHSRAPPATPA